MDKFVKYRLFLGTPLSDGIAALVLGCLIALLLVGAYVFSPQGYTISEQAIVVNRLVGNVRLPLESVREVRAATADDLRGCIRLFASGGLFGYFGLFCSAKLWMDEQLLT